MPTYSPPRDCPVCSHRLNVTQLGCPHCGTGLSGSFTPCEFCGLDDAARDVLRVFLGSRGNMKELERHLGVSYPTARARFDDVLRALGLSSPGNGRPSDPAGTSDRTNPSAAGRSWAAATDHLDEPPADPRLATLRAVARGELDVQSARQQLEGP